MHYVFVASPSLSSISFEIILYIFELLLGSDLFALLFKDSVFICFRSIFHFIFTSSSFIFTRNFAINDHKWLYSKDCMRCTWKKCVAYKVFKAWYRRTWRTKSQHMVCTDMDWREKVSLHKELKQIKRTQNETPHQQPNQTKQYMNSTKKKEEWKKIACAHEYDKYLAKYMFGCHFILRSVHAKCTALNWLLFSQTQSRILHCLQMCVCVCLCCYISSVFKFFVNASSSSSKTANRLCSPSFVRIRVCKHSTRIHIHIRGCIYICI